MSNDTDKHLPKYNSDEISAWDGFAAAALPAVVRASPTETTPEAHAKHAAELADHVMQQRAKRNAIASVVDEQGAAFNHDEHRPRAPPGRRATRTWFRPASPRRRSRASAWRSPKRKRNRSGSSRASCASRSAR